MKEKGRKNETNKWDQDEDKQRRGSNDDDEKQIGGWTNNTQHRE